MKRYIDNDLLAIATDIFRTIKELNDKDENRVTVSRRLNEFGYKAHAPATRPLTSKKNRTARLTYAEANVLWRKTDWDKVHFLAMKVSLI